MSRGAEVGCGPDHIVSDVDPAPPKEHSPQFSVHVFSGQMAGRIKMPLGRAVDLGPGDIVLDGDPAHLTPQRDTAPRFSAHVCCGQTSGWIKMPFGTEVGLCPSHIIIIIIIKC